MTPPTVTCTHCGRQRNCMLHTRADHPPTAAKAWLRKNCTMEAVGPKPCTFEYRAGVDVEGLRRALKQASG